jgi:hypothetical protein
MALYRYKEHRYKEFHHRQLGLPEHAARTRLYADIFTDVIARQGMLDGGGGLNQMFWIPQCVALHGLGALILPNNCRQMAIGGLALLDRIEARWGQRPFSTPLRSIVTSYHENWDGGGCPNQLRHTDIPLAARIAAIVEAYTQAVPLATPTTTNQHFSAIDRLYADRGHRFDPQLVEIFAGTSNQLLAISERPMQIPRVASLDRNHLALLTRRIRVPLKRRISNHAAPHLKWSPVASPNRDGHVSLLR